MGLWLGLAIAMNSLAKPGARLPDPASTSVVLVVQLGFTEQGAITQEWKEAIRNRHSGESLEAVARSRRKPTDDELQWMHLTNEKAPKWRAMIDSLRIPFPDISPPDTAVILIGNQGGGDAFSFAPSTICFDLSQLQALYGNATVHANADMLDRFFAHEFTHLLHKAWARRNPVHVQTPLEIALWDCLAEGLGNYRSLSDRWVRKAGGLTEHADSVLAKLEPVFVNRLAALEHASEKEATSLMKGLSSGPFDQKWGAVTVALWLVRETRGDDRQLRKWVEAGPNGILKLARIYLPEDLKRRLPSPK